MKNSIILIAILMAVACSKSRNETDMPQPVVDGYIRVNSTIAGEVASKAMVIQATALTDIQFLHATSAKDNLSVLNMTGVTPLSGNKAGDATGAITFDTAPMYDKTDDTKISYLKAYHPAGDLASNVVTWTPDGATDILVSDLTKSGTYTAPLNANMTFNHILSRVEVRCRAAENTNIDAVRTSWGKIISIKLKDVSPNITFKYATNTVEASGTKGYFSLLNGGIYDGKPLIPIDIPASGSTDIIASAMIPPTGQTSFTLVVTTVESPPMEAVVTLNNSNQMIPGRIYRATLSFNPADMTISTTSTTITDWKDGIDVNAPATPPVILEYGVLPFNLTGDVSYGATRSSYNGLYGEGETTNGTYRTTSALVHENEKPYYKFEIAKTDAHDGTGSLKLNWRQLQGIVANKSDNICVKTHGADWRIPRASELRLIVLNKDALVNTGAGFTAFTGINYFSATEYSKANMWYHNMGGSQLLNNGKTSNTLSVRCIRELP